MQTRHFTVPAALTYQNISLRNVAPRHGYIISDIRYKTTKEWSMKYEMKYEVWSKLLPPRPGNIKYNTVTNITITITITILRYTRTNHCWS